MDIFGGSGSSHRVELKGFGMVCRAGVYRSIWFAVAFKQSGWSRDGAVQTVLLLHVNSILLSVISDDVSASKVRQTSSVSHSGRGRRAACNAAGKRL